MICKIMQGAGFGNAVDYVMGKDEAEILDYKDVRIYDSKLVAKDFEMISKQNTRVTKSVMHIVVSFHKDDKTMIDNNKMKEIATEIINKMGYSNAQFIVVKHNDASHPHFHIIANRVTLDGKTVSDKYGRLKLNAIRLEIEQKNSNLISASGKNIGQSNSYKLKGKDAVKYKIYNAIKIVIQQSRNIEQLIKNLEVNHKILAELKYKRGSFDKIEGIKFYCNNTWLTGSKVDKNFSYLNLIKQMKQDNTIKMNIPILRQIKIKIMQSI